MTPQAPHIESLQDVISRSSPKTVPWLHPIYFWRREWKLAVSIIIGGAFLSILAPYTYKFDSDWDYLAAAIHCLAIAGVWITLNTLSSIEVESELASVIVSRLLPVLREIKSGRRPRIDISEMETKYAPVNTTVPTLAMIRLYKNICEEAKDRKFESSVTITSPYREEQLESIFRLQNLQKIGLWLGILGTFVGLILAISSGGLAKKLNDKEFIEVIKQMLDGLFVSFSASLAGLETAVILGFLLLLLRRRQEHFFKLMDQAAITALSLARNSINNDGFLAEFAQIGESISDLSARVYDQARTLGDVETQIREQTAQIQKGIGELVTAEQKHREFLEKIHKAQETFIINVTSLYDTASLENLRQTLNHSILRTGEQFATVVIPNITSIDDTLGDFNEAISALNKALAAQNQVSTAATQRIEGHLQAMVNELRSLNQRIDRDETGVSRALRAQMRELSDAIGQLSYSVGSARPITSRWMSFWGRFR